MLIGRRDAKILEETARAIFRAESVRPTCARYRPPIEFAPSVLPPLSSSRVPIVAGLRFEIDETLPPGIIRIVGASHVADVRIEGVAPVPPGPRGPTGRERHDPVPQSLLRGLLAGR